MRCQTTICLHSSLACLQGLWFWSVIGWDVHGNIKSSPAMWHRYLKWMVKNLKGGMLEDWVEYAQEVLDDPLYRDRIEWEKVEKLLVESHDLAKFSNNRDALAPARMYGWDLDNDAAWSKVNFSLLGTSKGGQIPRVPIDQEPKPKPVTPRKSKVSAFSSRNCE